MNITEVDSRKVLKSIGIPVYPAVMVTTPEEVEDIAKQNDCMVVVKAEIGMGSRGKYGGVQLLMPEEARRVSKTLFSRRIKGIFVDKYMIAPAVDIDREYYLSIFLDKMLKKPLIIIGRHGGGDIEEIAQTSPELIMKLPIEIDRKKVNISVEKIAAFMELPKRLYKPFDGIIHSLIDGFWRYNATLIEINPFAIDKSGDLIAVDAKVKIDDYSLDKLSNLNVDTMPYMTENEIKARKNGLSYFQINGDIACIVNGAGLAMATIDAISTYGMKPANFLDVGGSSSPEKIVNALSIIKQEPSIKAIFVNMFGGITRCSDIAKGLLLGLDETGDDIPLVVHISGNESTEAKEILKSEGITCHGSMRSALEHLREIVLGI